tara:strand:+ start:614 stop:787 length:174 start_codon:yes stop_codon:yes gene_type:complete
MPVRTAICGNIEIARITNKNMLLPLKLTLLNDQAAKYEIVIEIETVTVATNNEFRIV